MEKLAALVPPPRFNLVRYSGVFAPSSSWRRQIIPARPAEDSADFHCCKAAIRHAASTGKSSKKTGADERRYAWAELLRRVFSVDALKCDRCGGKMRILCAIHRAFACSFGRQAPATPFKKFWIVSASLPGRRPGFAQATPGKQYPLLHWEEILWNLSIN